MSAVKVLVVDDHPIFRDGLRTALDGLDDITVVGAVEDGTQALTATRELLPDVVLMDLNMPGMGGIEATRLITSTSAAAVLVLTMQADDESVFAAVRAGASGYLLKGSDRGDIIRSIASVAAGEAVFGPAIAKRMLAFFSGAPGAAHPTPFPELTAREREILDLVARGLGNQAIARRLTLAPKTVRNAVSTILGKLHASDRGDAIAQARSRGLGGQP
jgi:DNA-binding NarL/FixJ family response regulator